MAKRGLEQLIAALLARGYRVIGPKLQDGVINYSELGDARELPQGFTDEQAPGRYRAVRRPDQSLFGYAVGSRSLRSFFQVSDEQIVVLRRGAAAPAIDPTPVRARPLAIIGVRSCELHALAIQDRVLAAGAYPDPRYAARRSGALFIAVNCAAPSGTCFCVSMGTGPRAEAGFDLSLTELSEAGDHRFVVRAGSERGAELVRELGLGPATVEDCGQDHEVVERARGLMGRTLRKQGIASGLLGNLEHPEWDAVAERCLACTNCTMVCPTCFCTTTEDEIDVTGGVALRRTHHDSCFSQRFSHVHGGSVRDSIKSRYRQWLTHKFATWYDQFGSSGCVGCGRCITFCPVGIDVTEEITKIRGESNGA